MKQLFFTSFFVFTFIIFVIGKYFFGELYSNSEINNIESKYIDPVVIKETKDITGEEKKNKEVDLINKKTISLLDKIKNINNKITIFYNPNNYIKELSKYTNLINKILQKDIFSKKYKNIGINFYKLRDGTRARMKNRQLHFYEAHNIKYSEFIAVSIHELSHFFDLYYFVFGKDDKSKIFYEISWEDTKIIKLLQKQTDFVSGYSMTNKYEDFAETMTYFILHNNDFKQKAQKSKILQQKYDFFEKYLFKNNYVIESDYRLNNHKMKDYYRDITKIEYDFDKFLN